MQELEIKYLKPIELNQIDFNSEELKEQLQENLQKYEGLVVTENAIQEAKKTKADLNKFRTSIENERKRVKNICLEPYNVYENKIKELIKLVDAPILAIDTQVKNFEQQQKDKKLAEIKDIYEFEADNVSDIYTFEKAFNQQWLNAGVTLKKIKEDIINKVTIIKSDLQVISALNSEFELELYETYKSSLSIQDVILKNERLKSLKVMQLEAEEKARKELEEETIKIEIPEQVVDIETIGEEPTFKEITFKAIVTREQLELLTDFLIASDITFKQVLNASKY